MTKHRNYKHNQFQFKCDKCENRFECKNCLEIYNKSDHQDESVTNTKVKDKYDISCSNIGARKGRNIRDHLFVLNGVLNEALQTKDKNKLGLSCAKLS